MKIFKHKYFEIFMYLHTRNSRYDVDYILTRSKLEMYPLLELRKKESDHNGKYLVLVLVRIMLFRF